MKRFLRIVSAALMTAMTAAPVAAQTPYPSEQIRLIVPTPPGGASDTSARLLAQALSKSLGQAVVVDNKPGASGALAAQALMAAAPDGHTLMRTLASMSGLAFVQKAAPYQSLVELTPVSLVGRFAYAMFVHPEVPARSVAEFVDYARAHPDELSYATGSLGDYMASTKFLKATGIRSVRVPYKGGSQLLPDLLSGRVQLNFGPASNGMQHVKEGKLRMLAVLLPQRGAVAPEVPTLSEAGVPSVSLPSWQAIFAPPNTPTHIAERLSRELALALGDAALRGQYDQLALQVEGSTPQRLSAAVVQDTQVWRNFVSEYNIAQE
jgi:tripartite-type tricarboxylate transporter receptor subunit TctC